MNIRTLDVLIQKNKIMLDVYFFFLGTNYEIIVIHGFLFLFILFYLFWLKDHLFYTACVCIHYHFIIHAFSSGSLKRNNNIAFFVWRYLC